MMASSLSLGVRKFAVEGEPGRIRNAKAANRTVAPPAISEGHEGERLDQTRRGGFHFFFYLELTFDPEKVHPVGVLSVSDSEDTERNQS